MRALHTPWIYFGSSSTPQKENRQCRKERRWKDIVDGCPITCRLVLAPSPLRTNGALKVDPGGVRRPACLLFLAVASTIEVRRRQDNYCRRSARLLASHLLQVGHVSACSFLPDGDEGARRVRLRSRPLSALGMVTCHMMAKEKREPLSKVRPRHGYADSGGGHADGWSGVSLQR